MDTLWGNRGWGSCLVEAQLDWYGMPYRTEMVNPWKDPEGRERLRRVNPLVQLPTMVLADGSIMTESVAITFMLADRARAAGIADRDILVPRPEEAVRERYLRWQVFLVANIYPMFTIVDDVTRWVSGEEAQKSLHEHASAYRERMWAQVEANAGAGPWFLGDRFSALDIYIAVMTRWTPRRAYFAERCPRLTSIALAADREPRLAATWKRNFD